jgi:hypothetical protein
MFDESKVEAAVTFLHEEARDGAEARAERIKCEHMLKHIKALVMNNSEGSVSAQERDAYASDRYKEAIETLREAVIADELLRAKREAALALIDAWRTEQANSRFTL